MAETATRQKCAHLPCQCSVDPADEYCSDHCRDAPRDAARCDCPHAGCRRE
jgi:hypothetical protein